MLDNLTDDQLKQLAAKKMAQMQSPNDLSSLSDDQLRELASQKMGQQKQGDVFREKPSDIDMSEEADLGTLKRLQYSIEPIQTNREAFLVQEFGQDNVKKTPEGDILIKQRGKFRPVNAPGFSIADVSDIAGSAPEAIGATAGTLLGMGAASVPGAIAGGALGGAARQGLSALLGTPQKADLSERVGEVALSGALSGGGAILGKYAKEGAKKLVKQFPRIFPEKIIGEGVEKFADIAEEINIPKPTTGQLVGGRTLQKEKILSERPIFGSAIRKKVDEQVKTIKNNLRDIVGDFIDVESSYEKIGGSLRENAENLIETTRATASDLFDNITRQANDVLVPKNQVKSELLENLEKSGFRMFDKNSMPLDYSAKSGLTKKQFEKIQGVISDVLGGMDESGASTLREIGEELLTANDMNTLRKTIDSNIKEFVAENVDDYALLKLRESFMDATEKMLGAKDKKLVSQFKEARALWDKQLDLKKSLKKSGRLGFDKLSDEKILEKMFKDTKSLAEAEKIFDKKTIEDAAVGYLNNFFRKSLGGEEQIGAKRLLNIIDQKMPVLKRSLPKGSISKLKSNLEFLDRIGRPINPSRTAITQLMQLDATGLAKGAIEYADYATTPIRQKLGGEILKQSKKLPSMSAGAATLLQNLQPIPKSN